MKHQIKHIIRDILKEHDVIKDCGCGCNGAGTCKIKEETSTIIQLKGILSTNTTNRTQSEIISDIRSVPGITIVAQKEYKPDQSVINNPKYISIVSIKIDPHPFIGHGGFDDNTLNKIIDDIKKIHGVNTIKLTQKPIKTNVKEMKQPILETFRRIVITTDKLKETEDDLNRLFGLDTFKASYPELKHEIKKGINPKVLVIDLNGDSADSIAKKVKDIGVKFKASDIKIKNEKSMSNIKENKMKNNNLLHNLIIEGLHNIIKENQEETTQEVAKSRKLDKDEIGKFYVVTQPSKAKENIVHELTVLELANRLKSGEIDENKIMGVYSSRGHANSHSKDLLGEIDREMDELKTHMDEYRKFKNQGKDLKGKAMGIIQKYKK